jgi:hypothetical protein
MLRRHLAVLVGAILFWFGPALRAVAGGQEEAEVVAKAKAQVNEALERLRVSWARVEPVTNEAVSRAFADYVFFSVLFRRYPVAQVPPRPLKPSNLYAVRRSKEEAPHLLTSPGELETFCRTALARAEDDARAKDAVRAWLQLTTVFVQDGYYKFSLVDESVRVSRRGADREARGRVVVMAGGNGEIAVTLRFDAAGVLVKADEQVRVRPGPRPICQASKLLDPDPIVRAMAEQDLLYLGLAARDYMEEERAKAGPELRQAIDRVWHRIVAEER